MKNLFVLAVCLFSFSAASKSPLPSDSIYQINSTFTNQDGRNFQLQERQGKAQVVALFYTSCRFVCPLIIYSAKAVDRALSNAEQKKLSILLVSMDPNRDTPAILKSVAIQRKIDLQRWTLARTNVTDVRTLAAVLGVRYRELDDGEFNHTSVLILLDDKGRIKARTETLGSKPDPEFMQAVKSVLAIP